MKDMIDINGVFYPSTYEKAIELFSEKSLPIEQARKKVIEAKAELLQVCIREYPIGTRVRVNIASGSSPQHEVISINQNGWMTLRNTSTGTERSLSADSYTISPDCCWYTAKTTALKD